MAHLFGAAESSETPTEAVAASLSRPLPASPVADRAPSSPLVPLVGRDTTLAAIHDLLAHRRVRLLTLTGPGGVGKTRLAIAVAERAAADFVDGVFTVPLATLTDPELVLPMIARELGLQEIDARPGAELLTNYLRTRSVLLVLDNLEQILPAARQIVTLLADCPRMAALVTSRAPLRVTGEQRFPVEPLALPQAPVPGTAGFQAIPFAQLQDSAAVQLLVARAQAVDPRFVLDAANAAAVADICHRLDGLPLAIELVAARLAILTPHELLHRLVQALPILTHGAVNAPSRHRTMRDTIAWSYGLLTTEEARFFRALAYFVGGFALDAAEYVGGDGLPALDLLTALVDKSLIRRTEVAGRTRFQMLETIREFALEQSATHGDLTRAAERHAAWYRRLADDIRQSGQLSQARGLQTLETELPNLRAALTWFLERGEAESAMHLTGQLAEFWFRHGHFTEGQAWLERALASGTDAPSAARAAALVGLALMHWPQNEYARAEELLREAERVAQAAGDPGALAYARLHQGYVAYFQGDVVTMVARAEENLTAIESIPQGFGQHPPLLLLASAALVSGDDERAFELYQRLLVSARACGDEISLANALHGVAIVAARQGEFLLALSSFAEAATACHHFGDQHNASLYIDGAATVAAAQGRLQSAVRLFAAAEEQRVAVGGMRQTLPIYEQAKAEADYAFLAAFGAGQLRTAKDAGAALALTTAIDEVAALARDRGLSLSGLTAREREVLYYLVTGESDKEIAERLGISSRTVSKHVITIRTKLAAPSRTAAAAIAIRDHLV